MRQLSQKSSKFSGKNTLLWLLVIVFFVAIVFGNLHFSTVHSSIRVGLSLLGLLVLGGIYSLTQQGKSVLGFVREAHTELKKVVWPTRKETIQTAILIFLIVLVATLILWGVDAIFALLVSSILI